MTPVTRKNCLPGRISGWSRWTVVPPGRRFWPAAALCCALAFSATARGVLMYDQEKGVIFIDGKDTLDAKPRKTAVTTREGAPAVTGPKRPSSRSKTDIHVDREKDPPELYFKSGLEYFRNADYENALKNFGYAARSGDDPRHLLWMAKTYRQLGKPDRMLAMMEGLVRDWPESGIADDALFEIAYHYETTDDYEAAGKKYLQLAEQYPFGISVSNGEDFLEVSRRQRRVMRAEMISALKFLGVEGETIEQAYANFQRAHALEVTGTGTAATVKAIKAEYRKKTRAREEDQARTERVRRAIWWVSALGVLLLIDLLFLLHVRSGTDQIRRRLSDLGSLVSEMDPELL